MKKRQAPTSGGFESHTPLVMFGVQKLLRRIRDGESAEEIARSLVNSVNPAQQTVDDLSRMLVFVNGVADLLMAELEVRRTAHGRSVARG